MLRTLAGLAGVALAASFAGQAGAQAARDDLAPHHSATSASSAAAKPGGRLVDANPYLAYYAQGQPDFVRWMKKLNAASAKRAATIDLAANRRAVGPLNRALPPAFVHDEEEPAGTAGSNDSVANSERIPEFGTAAAKSNRVRILGALADLSGFADSLDPVPEDNGAIPLAGTTGIDGSGAVVSTGVLGDGPHGTITGDGSNDFDFYRLDADAGLDLLASTEGSQTDTFLGLYDPDGNLLALDDDGGQDLTSVLRFTVPEAGTYYLMVAGYSPDGTLPADPFDSGSGSGGAAEGDYDLALAVNPLDRDFYSVRLRPGDVLGGVANGGADGLTVFRSDGEQRVGSSGLDASFLYPPNAPLPGGGNTTFAYVAEEGGWYTVQVTGAIAPYDVLLEAYRPGTEVEKARQKQTVFLDFDGERVNTAVWGGPGVRTLSPFSAFIGKWGLAKAQEGQLVKRITQEVRENVRNDLIAKGLNDQFDVRIVNSRNSDDIFGDRNVSRVIVAGTMGESGIPVIGVAQYIDPGNYGLEDQALVLLDTLSDPTGDASLNTYLDSSSDRVAFVSQAVGNMISHEIGHLVGNYHTDNQSPVTNIEDAGGGSFDALFGVGPDGIGGTTDDTDVDFTTDIYDTFEGFTGLESTLNTSAWAYVFH